MTLHKARVLWFASAIAITACDDPPEMQGTFPIIDAGPDGQTPEGDGGNTASDAGDAGTTPAIDGSTGIDATVPSTPVATYAVVSSEFGAATSIALLDQEGNLLQDELINTGSQKAGLNAALSGDVELPRASADQGTLVILDRGTDVVTRLRVADGTVLGQIKLVTPPTQGSTTASKANPGDYVWLDAQSAWVTRSNPNLESNTPEIDKGNDLFRINPSTSERTTDRIDLSALGSSGATPTYAYPTRLVRLGNYLVVGTTNAAAGYASYGEGRIGLVNLTTKAVTPVAIPGLKNCIGVDRVPNDTDTVLVSCAGDYTDAEGPAGTSGYALVGIKDGAATIEHSFNGLANDFSAYTAGIATSLGGTLLVSSNNSYSELGESTLAVLDVATGSVTVIKKLERGNRQFGTPAFSAATGLLLVTDSSTDANLKPNAGVRRFKRAADGSFSELAVVPVAKTSLIPARHVYPL